MADVLKIACVQTDIIARNPSENFRHLDELFAKIQDDRDIIILPETFTTGFPAEPELFAEDENGPTMTWLRQKAKERNCVICGSFITSFSQQPYHNTLVWMNPDGSYHTYNKRHTFMGGEKEQLRCGQDLVTINYKGWKIRPFVCYDLRFPVWLRNTYKEGEFEYDLAILIANWPQPKAYIWNTLLSARAIENQAYFIGVNRVGTDHNNVPYIGGTKIVNAKGRTVAEIAGDKENILEAEIDMESMSSFRNHFIVHKDWDDFKIV
ncbi:MAG: nitrilase family protein [Bacteroidales bacterium]|nr:nitrilase family protein [Bacteroidales bacterium]